LDTKTLDRYVGRYQFNDTIFFNVRRAEGHLQGQMTGQSYLDMYPSAEREFFCDLVKAQITFNLAANGEPASLVLHQGGMDQTAKKISDELPPQRVAIKFDPAVFEAAYAGDYEFQPGTVLTVRRRENRFFVKLTGQSFLEIFPETQTDFFLKAVDAQLTFVKNAKGEINAVILHQNGMDQTARRMK